MRSPLHHGHQIRMAPPLCLTEAQLDEQLDIIEKACVRSHHHAPDHVFCSCPCLGSSACCCFVSYFVSSAGSSVPMCLLGSMCLLPVMDHPSCGWPENGQNAPPRQPQPEPNRSCQLTTPRRSHLPGCPTDPHLRVMLCTLPAPAVSCVVAQLGTINLVS